MVDKCDKNTDSLVLYFGLVQVLKVTLNSIIWNLVRKICPIFNLLQNPNGIMRHILHRVSLSPQPQPIVSCDIKMVATIEKPSLSFRYAVLFGVIAVLFPILKTYLASDPLMFMLPNLLLFTPFRESCRGMWKKYVKYNTAVTFEPSEIPIIQAKDYSFEALRHATSNFRYPALVRDLFADTPAIKKWSTVDYLSSKIGDIFIPFLRDGTYGTIQLYSFATFREIFTNIVTDQNSKSYLFFPANRVNMNNSKLTPFKEVQSKINEIVHDDLELDSILWHGFGTSKHKNYFGSQLIIGQGSNDTAETTGTGWHCAAGNNWFVQVVGRKRWYFLDPKYSAYMKPLRGGLIYMSTGSTEMAKVQKHLPLKYVDMGPGDLLYNPDWEWHTIVNHEGKQIIL